MQLVQKVRKKLKEKGEEEKKDDDRKKGKERMEIRKKVVSVKRRGIDEWRGGEIKWVERGGGGKERDIMEEEEEEGETKCFQLPWESLSNCWTGSGKWNRIQKKNDEGKKR